MKWKDRFLSSGLPLEHCVSKVLVDLGFTVNGEFQYSRYGPNSSGDFSIDINADGFVPAMDAQKLAGELKVLVECKYRSDQKVWVFSPDVNKNTEWSPFDESGVRQFPSFTAYKYSCDAVYSLCAEPAHTFKGVELNLSNGDATADGIRHGINQLRYALPEVFASLVRSNSIGHPVDCNPFFVLPILVTNAPLYLMKVETDIADVRNAGSLDDFAERVDCVDLRSESAGDFRAHSRHVFLQAGLGRDLDSLEFPMYALLDEFRKQNRSQYGPSRALALLRDGYSGNPLYSQFWICQFDALPRILAKIMDVLDKTTTNGEILID